MVAVPAAERSPPIAFSRWRNMGTSVKMLENFDGHTSNRALADEDEGQEAEGAAVGIEAKRQLTCGALGRRCE
jgi:hypothetical protein